MNIFDRLPSGIFNALTGKNNRRAWDLLVRLFEHYFGPDAVPDYPDGYLHEKIVREIERFLLDSGWESELDSDDGESATPLAIQANQLLTRLVDTGWLCEERVPSFTAGTCLSKHSTPEQSVVCFLSMALQSL